MFTFVYWVICVVPVLACVSVLHGGEFIDKLLKKLVDLKVEQGIVVSISPNHDVDK